MVSSYDFFVNVTPLRARELAIHTLGTAGFILSEGRKGVTVVEPPGASGRDALSMRVLMGANGGAAVRLARQRVPRVAPSATAHEVLDAAASTLQQGFTSAGLLAGLGSA